MKSRIILFTAAALLLGTMSCSSDEEDVVIDGTWKITEKTDNGSTTNYPVEITGTVPDDNWRGETTFRGCPYEATINEYINVKDGSWYNIEKYSYEVDLMDGHFSTGNFWDVEEGGFTASGSSLTITFTNEGEQYHFEGTFNISGNNISIEGTRVFDADPDESIVIKAVKVDDSEIEGAIQ